MAALRLARPDDAGFLASMLVEAVNWDPDRAPVALDDVLRRPEFAHYVSGWRRATDAGVVAAEGDQLVGAAWYRFFTEDDAGFGFVDATTPEVTIGVAATHRGSGIGTQLLHALVDLGRSSAVASLSLSVEKANPAMRLYARTGFVPVRDDGDAVTMRLALAPP